jgi:hypothetical protein
VSSQGGLAAVGAPDAVEAVDDLSPDGDDSYLTDAGGGGAETFELAAIPPRLRGRVRLVQVTAIARGVETAGEVSARLGVRVDGATSATSVTVRPEYRPELVAWAANPGTGSRWRLADAIAGLVEASDPSAGALRVTAVWWDVVVSPRRGG